MIILDMSVGGASSNNYAERAAREAAQKAAAERQQTEEVDDKKADDKEADKKKPDPDKVGNNSEQAKKPNAGDPTSKKVEGKSKTSSLAKAFTTKEVQKIPNEKTNNLVTNPQKPTTEQIKAFAVQATGKIKEEEEKDKKSGVTPNKALVQLKTPPAIDTDTTAGKVMGTIERFREGIIQTTKKIYERGLALLTKKDAKLSKAELETIAAAGLVSAAAATAGFAAAGLTLLAQGLAEFVQRNFPQLSKDVRDAATVVMLGEVFNTPATTKSPSSHRGDTLA